MFEFDILWPDNLSVLDLRFLVLQHINQFGEPLRWAITDVKSSKNNSSIVYLRVESMLIVS